MNPSSLLGCSPSSKDLATIIGTTAPEIKSYPDAVYFNYYSLGLSLLFAPQGSYKPKSGLVRSELKDDSLLLDSIDFYNIPKANAPSAGAGKSSRKSELAFSSYSISPLVVTLAPAVEGDSKPRASEFSILPVTTGKEFVGCLGEPDRKGGGAGPSSGSIGIWCEWSKDGLMVEFGGDEAKGPQAWERGKDAVWRVLTMFRVKPTT